MTPIDPEVHASITSICYKPLTRIGYLRLAHRHVPDMTGTIALFTRISPAVERILVYDGRHLNTQYAKHKGTWSCVSLAPSRGNSR